MPTFNEVGMAILSERKYQDSKWAELDEVNNPDDFITYIEDYTRKLREASATEKQDFFRKVAALGVVAMEKFGAPQRSGYECESCPACTLLNDGDNVEIAIETEGELSPEDLDVLVSDGQVAKVVERGIWYRVKEKSRSYVYDETDDEPGATHTFHDIRAFAVMPSGGHRLIDNCGTGYYVQPGWTVLAVPDCEHV